MLALPVPHLSATPFLAILFVAIAGIGPSALAREWSDATGKFKVEAELDDLAGEMVRLRKPSGEMASVPLARLCKDDQEFIAAASKLATEAQAVLRQHCYSCHGKDGSDEGGMNFVLTGKRLVERGKIVAGKPDESPLWDRIASGEMPPADVKSRPTEAQRQTLRDWIDGGGFSPSHESERSPVEFAAMHEAMAADLKAADERTRIYYRYFTFAHLYNAGLSSDELDTVRLALAKLLNSLSWDRKIIAPQPVDPDETIYRVDIRDLRWTVELWDVLVSAYPYAIEHAGKPAAECYKLSGTKIPHLRADWFVAAASRPPLYHHLLQLPKTLVELQAQMKVSFRQNLRQDRALRAGFTKSGVSQHPRVIERHETADGACWVSYDFAGARGARNFFNEPLAFEFDGNEVIFSLPNGLQGFAIFDREGKRLDKAPTNIVRDLQSPDASVINGVSCFRCHAGGAIPKQDEVRSHAEANAKAFKENRATVLALYPEAKVLQEAFKEDQARYREAMETLGVKRISPAGEPIYNTARRFREPIDLVRASAELGRTSEDFRKAIERGVELQKLVGPLRVGGSVPREVFDEAFGALLGPLGLGRHLAPAARLREPGEALAGASRESGAGGDDGDDADGGAADSGDGDSSAAGEFGDDRPPGKDIRGGLAHHWKFDEKKGNLARDSQGRNNASLGNWDADEPRWVEGKIGGALQFSRPEHIAIVGRDIDFPQMTIAFWLQMQLERGTNPRLAHPWVTLRLENALGISVLGRITEPTKPATGEWYHYAVTIDQAKHKTIIYRDGDEVAGGRLEAERDKGAWVFGHNQDPGNHGDTLNGLLDDIRVYKRLLSAEEVSQLARWGLEE